MDFLQDLQDYLGQSLGVKVELQANTRAFRANINPKVVARWDTTPNHKLSAPTSRGPQLRSSIVVLSSLKARQHLKGAPWNSTLASPTNAPSSTLS